MQLPLLMGHAASRRPCMSDLSLLCGEQVHPIAAQRCRATDAAPAGGCPVCERVHRQGALAPCCPAFHVLPPAIIICSMPSALWPCKPDTTAAPLP